MRYRHRELSALHGALAGFTGTAAMTAFLGLAQRAGLLGQFPPKRIVKRATAVLDESAKLEDPELDVVTAVAHVGFGMASGALFGALYGRTRDLPAPGWLQGALFGAALWTASYACWVPALGILPKPSRDRNGRPTTMFLSHLIYGATLGARLQANAERSRETTSSTSPV